MKLLTSIFILFLGFGALNAQTIDEELGFIYVKADYLLETDRYEDAIREFTKIIAKDPSYKDALYKRGKAKYAIAAFKGTKNDLLQSFELVGITPESLELFGKTQQNLDETEAASVTLETASMLKGGTSRSSSDNKSNDKSDTAEGEEGSGWKDELGRILDDLLPDRKTDEGTGTDTGTSGDTGNTETGRTDKDTPSSTEEGKRQSGDSPSEIIVKNKEEEVKEEPKEPEVDNSINEIFIDEDLTLEVKNGLGARKILQQPNILILSDASGVVSVDICVNSNGKVTSAEFNKSESSISTQSLVSLAVRKSKEFWFKSSVSEDMCGSIVFIITGS